MNHHRRIKQPLLPVFAQSPKVLQVRGLRDLFDGFLVGHSQAFLDHERSEGDSSALRRGSHSRSFKALTVTRFDFTPRNQGH